MTCCSHCNEEIIGLPFSDDAENQYCQYCANDIIEELQRVEEE